MRVLSLSPQSQSGVVKANELWSFMFKLYRDNYSRAALYLDQTPTAAGCYFPD